MATTAELNRKLDEAIFSGKALEAFEEYYAETVVMQENTDPPWEGKYVNRKR